MDIEDKQKREVVGIDPGKKTGLAVYDRYLGKIVFTVCADFHRAYDMLSSYSPKYTKYVVIEVPSTGAVWHRKATTRSAQDKTAVNVGSVLREASLLVERAESLGHKVIQVHPRGKTSKDYVKRITGYDGKPNNEHVRDAIMLCWGR